MRSPRTIVIAVVGVALVGAATVWSLSGQRKDAPPKSEPQVLTKPAPFDNSWDPPQEVDPEAYRQRFAKYFEPEFQKRQAERIDPNLNVDALHPSTIRGKDEPLGTLFIDNKGEVVLAIKHPLVSPFSEGLALVATAIQPKSRGLTSYGYVDRTGKLVIPGAYEQGQDFHNGLAAVRSGARWGYINRQGEVVIPFRYQIAEDFRDGIARVQPDFNRVLFIDTLGKVLLEGDGGDMGRFSEGLLYVNLAGERGKDSGRARGYVDRNFKFVNRLGEDSSGFFPARCEEFHEGRAAVEIGSNKWGFIDRDGKLVVPAQYSTVQPFSEGVAGVAVGPGIFAKTIYIDKSGKVVLEPQVLGAGLFKEGLAVASISMEKEDAKPDVARPIRRRFGYIDRTGKVVIPPKYYMAEPFKHGLAAVAENPWHRGYIDKTGKVVWQVTEPTYGFNPQKAEAQENKPMDKKPMPAAKVGLELKADKTTIKVGETPSFRAELINQGDKEITIVQPGDGSECGWRTPIVRWSPPMRTSIGRCGNINALKASEVVTLKPGERVLVSGWLGLPSLGKAGTHKVVLEMENVPGLEWGGLPLGKHDPAAMEKVRQSRPFKAVSNTVEVKVEE
jgi:hypothetical protein